MKMLHEKKTILKVQIIIWTKLQDNHDQEDELLFYKPEIILIIAQSSANCVADFVHVSG